MASKIIKILLVEAFPDHIEMFRQILEKNFSNYTLEITDTEEGLKQAIQNYNPDIILSNTVFPDFEGKSIFNLAKELAPQTSFIFISETAKEESLIYFFREGLGDFVLKEDIENLPSRIKLALEKFESKNIDDHLQNHIKELEATYRAIFENSLDGILLYQTDGKIIRANPATCKMLKMTEEEIISKGRDGIINKNDLRIVALVEERIKTGSAKGEINLIRKDGSSFSAFASTSKFIDSVGRERVSVSIHDLSERLKSQGKLDTTTHLLKETVNRLNKTLDSSMDVICTIDDSGKFVDINAASLKIWGYTPEELKGTQILELVYKEDLEKTINEVSTIKHGVVTEFFENRYVHKNGTIVSILWSARWDEALQLVLCVAKDITDKKTLEKTLQQEKRRFQGLYEQAPSAMGILKGPNHIYELANPPYLKLISKSDENDIIGKSVKEVLPELESQGILDLLDHVYQTGETFSASEMLFQFDFNANGKFEDAYLDLIYQAHRDSEGNIDGILFFVNDVTEQVVSRKKIEHINSELSSQIKLTQNRQEELLIVNKELSDFKFAIDESCNVAITDQNGIITHANDNFCTTSKYCREELVGQDLRIVKSGYHPKEFIRTMWQTISKGKIWKGELKNKAKDGTEYWVDTTIIPFLDTKGKPYQYVSTRFEITERKKAEIDLDLQNKKLIKTNTELDRFVYSVSHDLRAPLTSILGIINFIEDESGEPETIKHILMIRESVYRLDNFIKNILNYSRNNRLSLKVQKIDLQKNINEIVRSYRGNPDTKNIEFIIDINQQQPFYMDQLRLNTIIENLISNAIKYHKEKGTNNFIKISSDSDSEELRLTITDNGVGIDPKYHTKIFDMFYRLNSKKVGSGIGLYIVKDTIEILQGTIAIESELNKGTSFTITLKNLKS